MLIATTPYIGGYRVAETKGHVFGLVVRSRGLAFIAGLIVVSAGGPAAPDGIGPLVLGGALLIAVVLERQRYRSEAAERLEVRPGPGGGEPEALPARFQRTEERFVDPTTNL